MTKLKIDTAQNRREWSSNPPMPEKDESVEWKPKLLSVGDRVACRFGRPFAPGHRSYILLPGNVRVPIDVGTVIAVEDSTVTVNFGGGAVYRFVNGVMDGYTHVLEQEPDGPPRSFRS